MTVMGSSSVHRMRLVPATLVLLGILGGCDQAPPQAPAPDNPAALAGEVAAAGGEAATEQVVQVAGADAVQTNPLRDAYFGNLHVHTGWSFNASTNGSITRPDGSKQKLIVLPRQLREGTVEDTDATEN